MWTLVMLLEQQPPARAPNPLFNTLLMVLIMFGIIYFLIIRPQQREKRAHQAMLDSLKKNDLVVTQGGIYGTVAVVEKEAGTVILKVADNVRIKVARSAITRKVERGEGEKHG